MGNCGRRRKCEREKSAVKEKSDAMNGRGLDKSAIFHENFVHELMIGRRVVSSAREIRKGRFTV